MIGKTVSHYKILKKIGSGGMGEVYLAQDTKLNREVALKFLLKSFSEWDVQDDSVKQRFIHEARAAAALDHPNICNVHEIGETEDGQIFIAMSYYEGQTLSEIMSGAPLPLDKSVAISIQISEGLFEAHKKEIVHRDIKPANMVITTEGVVKILDFGLAKQRGGTKLTKDNSTLGTTAYMSPEQAIGDTVDHRTDIWSLGVLMYEMITGQLPFKGEYTSAVIHAILNEDPKPVTGLRTGVPLELEAVIIKALSKDQRERYQNIEDLLVDLKRIEKNIGVQLPRTSILGNKDISIQTKRIRTYKKKAGLFAIGLTVILVIFALWLFLFQQKKINSLAILPFVNQSNTDDLSWLSTGIPETIISSLQKIPGLRVTSFLTLLERYGDAQPSVEDVKNHYNVRAVAKGRVAMVQQNLSVHIEIVDTGDMSVIFARKYQVEGMDKLLELQEKIATEITDHLQNNLFSDSVKPVFLNHKPDNAAYHNYLRGRHFWYKRNPRSLNQALVYFKKAIEIDPEYALAWSGLADTYNVLPQYTGISRYRVEPLNRKAAEKAMELDENLAESNTSMGGLLTSEGKFPEAEKYFERAIEINPNYLLAYHWSGLNLSASRRSNDAIDRFQQALALDPMSPQIAGNMAMQYQRLGENDQARKILNRAIKLNPERSSSLIQYAIFQSTLGEHRKAVELAEKALTLDPGCSLWIAGWVSQINLRASNSDRAIRILEEMIEKDQVFKRAVHSKLGSIYRQLKQFDKSIEHHRKAIEIDPLDIDSYYNLGWSYWHFKEWEKAAYFFKKTAELAPEDGGAHQMLGCVLGILGQVEKERKCYERAAELMPLQNIELGILHLSQGEYEKAASSLIKHEKISPNYPNNSFYLFTAQFLSGDYSGAEKSLTEWLKRLKYKDRESLRARAMAGKIVDRQSLERYIRLILETFKKEKRLISGSYEARLSATFYCLIGDLDSAIKTLQYAYEKFNDTAFWLPWYIRFAHFKPLHNDPRFWEIIKKLKLDPYFKKGELTKL